MATPETSTRTFNEWKGVVDSDVEWRSPKQQQELPASWNAHIDSPEFAGVVPKGKECVYRKYHPSVQNVLCRGRIKSLSENWMRERQLHATATNIAAIVYKNPDMKVKSPYVSRNKIFLKKTGRGPAFTGNPACRHGQFYEPEAIRVYEIVTGIKCVPEDIGLLISEQNEEIAATPDAMAEQYPLLIEVKCPYSRAIEHNIPSYYYPQVQCQMAVCGMPQTHFVQYYPPSAFRRGMIDIIVINFDKIWWTKALSMVLVFWEEVKTHYMAIGKPIGTQTLDWKSKKRDARKNQKRTRAATKTCGSGMLDSPGLLSMKMVQRSVAVAKRCKIEFCVADPPDSLDCDSSLGVSDGIIEFDIDAVRGIRAKT